MSLYTNFLISNDVFEEVKYNMMPDLRVYSMMTLILLMNGDCVGSSSWRWRQQGTSEMWQYSPFFCSNITQNHCQQQGTWCLSVHWYFHEHFHSWPGWANVYRSDFRERVPAIFTDTINKPESPSFTICQSVDLFVFFAQTHNVNAYS
jgi:hypothetical protein